MKGYLAQKYGCSLGTYTDLMVLESAAGFYIGTLFIHEHSDLAGLHEPGSRESEYFPTYEVALSALVNQSWTQRENP